MKLTIALAVVLTAAGLGAQSLPSAAGLFGDVNVRHVIGLTDVKRNATGSLSVHDGQLEFKTGKAGAETTGKVAVSSIDDVFIGTETTAVRGKSAKVVRTAAYAAPFESGRALSILMRNKVDILTISYRDADGALHGAIFALPVGQAEPVRDKLVQAGAHASPSNDSSQPRP